MIYTTFKAVAAAMREKNNFIYGEKGWQNMKADKGEKKLFIFLDEPIFSEDIFRQGGLLDVNYRVKMGFFYKGKLADSPEEYEPVIQQAREARREFINRLKSLKDPTTGEHIFRDVTNTTTLNAHNIFDVNLTGVLVELTAMPLVQDGVCFRT